MLQLGASKSIKVIADEKLPEGRLIIPFSILFSIIPISAPGIALPTIPNFPYDLADCAVQLVDIASVSGPAKMSAAKSLQFTVQAKANVQNSTTSVPLFVFVQDTGQLITIPLGVDAPPSGDYDNAWVSGCVPLISGTASKIYFIKPPNHNPDTTYSPDGFGSFILANYEMEPYFFTGKGVWITP